MAAKFEIEKFNGNNFSLWKLKIRAILRKDNCLKAIEGRPSDITDEKWREMDDNAVANLHLAMADSVLSSIAEKTTAKEIWDTLVKLYEVKSLHTRIFLKRKLYTLRMSESTAVTDHINNLNTLFAQLSTADFNIVENERAELLLQSLPDSYDQLIINITNNNVVGRLSFEDVAGAILEEESRRKNKEDRLESSKQAEALTMMRGRSMERGSSGSQNHGRSKSRGRKNLKCYNCGMRGHMKKDCWHKKSGGGKNSEASTSQGCVASTQEDGEILYSEAISSRGEKQLHECWILDSGATWHMTPNRDWFCTYESISGGSVFMGNDHALEIAGVGTIKLKMYDGTIRTIQGVRHVKGLKKNLLSIGQLDDLKCKIHVEGGILKVVKGNLVVMKAEKITSNLYLLLGETLQEADASVAAISQEEATMMWHRRLGHMSERGLKILAERNLLSGLKMVTLPFCEHCVTSKQHRLQFAKVTTRSKHILDLIHSDVWESPEISMGGAKYFVSFIDDYSRRLWVYPIKKKSDVFPVFKEFKAQVELDTGKRIKCLRTDNGGEYIDGDFLAFCKQEGIKRQFTVAHTPQQNGVAERMNRTLLERTRAMLRTAGLAKSFWAEAVKTACYLINRSPSTAIGLKTPMEMWNGKPSNYSSLHVFGCPVYVMYNSQERTKLDPKSRKCIFLGYADNVKGYRLWDPTARKVVVSRDVVFAETELQKEQENDSTIKDTSIVEIGGKSKKDDTSEAEQEHEEQEPDEANDEEVQQIRRERRRPSWHSDYVMASHDAYCLLTEEGEPSTFQEALRSSDVSQWMAAMHEEIEALHRNKTWELVDLPKGRKAIGCKWVYKIKRDGNDQVERYRARLVVKGYAQKEGIDFNEIFSPVVRLTTIRVVLAMCAAFNLHLEQLDVKTAFLHGELQEEIYMLQPEGFKEQGKENLVCRLTKSLYGLKQAPRCWYKRFDSFIISLGYNRLSSDHCTYYNRFDDNDFIILLLYVDDMLVVGPNKDQIQELKAQLAREFDMKDLGPANKILGMQIHRDRKNRRIWLSQKNYLLKVLRRFNMQDCKPISTPLPVNYKLSSSMSPSNEAERMEMSRVPYASAVGSLMYAMICTRPDIAQAVGAVSRFMADPGREHWSIVKRILRYIKGTSDVALCFEGSEFFVRGYVDSDFAGDLDKRKSTTGYVFTLAGGAVSWLSKLQTVVALSTTEAEYMAATQACKEAIWIQRLLEELGHKQEKITVYCDSQSALHIARNPAFHSRTKHIGIQYHFVREVVEEGKVDMQKIHTKDNIADVMTKPVNTDKFTWCRSLFGLLKT
uniref:Retrovirus-related Pol polyprotein from transposon TNT 1-94 n=2 Tax=Cajanus cajan TaxID=3821 RepID=A0A151RJN4_CAJCA|nr:Retrovirus-related Pol polyprotein from transposon TNT 1-94 [Cajanus cajan]